MAISNYTELVATISDWLLRQGDDIFAARVPNLIALHEATLDKTLRSIEMEAEADLVTAAGVATVDIPTDYIEARSLTLPGQKAPPLDQYSPEALDEEFAGETQGIPTAFTVWGRRLRLGKTPADVYPLRFRYYKRVPRLSDDAPENDVLLAHPDIYLYGPLLQAAPTLKDMGAVELWRDAYTTAINLANDNAQRSLVSSAKIRRRYGS